MKRMVFALVAASLLTACSGDEPTVVGAWKNEKYALTIAEDGKFEAEANGQKRAANWKIEGDAFVLTVPGREEEHETVEIGVDPSTVARGRKLLREEVGAQKANGIPTGDPEVEQPGGDVVLHLYFQGNPEVVPCEYKLNANGEEPRLTLNCGYLLKGEFTR